MLKNSSSKISEKFKHISIKKYFEIIFAPAFIVIMISILTLLGIYGNPYFIDFSILFSGAYKITAGLIPFVDFSVPPIPISLYIPAFFQLIFGSNIFAMAMVTIILSSVLSIIFYKSVRKYFPIYISIFLSILFHLSFAGILAYPWYNQIAFFFFLLNFFLIFSIIGKKDLPNYYIFISSILVLLSFFSKNEIGVIYFCLLTSYLIYAYPSDMKKITLYFILPTIAIIFSVLFFIKSISNPVYFNFGIEQLINKIKDLFTPFGLEKLFFSFSLLFLIIIIYLLFATKRRSFLSYRTEKNNRLIALLIFLNLFIVFACQLSGLSTQTRVLALPMNLFLFYLLVLNVKKNTEKILSKDILNKFLAIFLVLFILASLNLFASPEENFFKHPFRQAGHIVSYSSSNYFRVETGCYKGAIFSKDTYGAAFAEINSQIKEVKNSSEILYLDDFLKFIECDFSLSHPKGLPLWFHEGITFKERDLDYVLNVIKENHYKLIIINFMVVSSQVKGTFAEDLEKLGYEKESSVNYFGLEPHSVYIYTLKKE